MRTSRILIPLCRVIFHYENCRPLEGYFLWILGMLMVLVSGLAVRQPTTGD